jgi:hypothetical protein
MDGIQCSLNGRCFQCRINAKNVVINTREKKRKVPKMESAGPWQDKFALWAKQKFAPLQKFLLDKNCFKTLLINVLIFCIHQNKIICNDQMKTNLIISLWE